MRSTPLLALVALGCAVATVLAQSRPEDDLAGHVRALEDREAIRALWADYGRTLDARDFAAFAQLFARDAEFVGSPGSPARGPAAIGAFLERPSARITRTPRGRNFHLYVNESIDLRGDEGTGVSDQFVREDGRWKFKRREVIGEIPVPRAAPR